MLNPEQLRMLVRAQPFRPVRVVMNSGRKYEIRHPEWVKIGRSWINVYEADDTESGIFDRYEMVSIMLMEHTEFVETPASAAHTGSAT